MLFYLFFALVGIWLVGAVGILLGIACVSLTKSRGPRMVRIAAGAGVVLNTTVFILLGVATGDLVWSLLAAFVCSAALVLSVRNLLARMMPSDHTDVGTPEMVRDFGLTYFAVLDVDGDGVITSEDLAAALTSRVLETGDRWLITEIQNRIALIGHWIGSHRTEETGELTDSNGEVLLRRTFGVVHSDYGIDRTDLKTYPRRAKRAGNHQKPAALRAY